MSATRGRAGPRDPGPVLAIIGIIGRVRRGALGIKGDLPRPSTLAAVAPVVSVRAGNLSRGRSNKSRTNSRARDSITAAMLSSWKRTWRFKKGLRGVGSEGDLRFGSLRRSGRRWW